MKGSGGEGDLINEKSDVADLHPECRECSIGPWFFRVMDGFVCWKMQRMSVTVASVMEKNPEMDVGSVI